MAMARRHLPKVDMVTVDRAGNVLIINTKRFPIERIRKIELRHRLQNGKDVAVVHIGTVWPEPENAYTDRTVRDETVGIVEGYGPLSEEIRQAATDIRAPLFEPRVLSNELKEVVRQRQDAS
jgi:hypothetical protein